jgi:predicted amidohydrolase/AraC-like DNA-binding protein
MSNTNVRDSKAKENSMRIAMTQMDIVWEDKEANLTKGEALIAQAAAEGAEMIIFPEMSFTGFSMDVEGIGETKSCMWKGERVTPTAYRMLTCSERYDIAVVFGYVLQFPYSDGQITGKNTLMCAAGGEILAVYEKIHPFTFGEEGRYYVGGDEVITCKYKGIPFSFFICYDLRFPEVFQLVSGQAQAITVIANWPKERIAHWEILLRARAVENQAYLIGVNRTGSGGGLVYEPSSMMIDPYGERVQAQEQGELCFAELDTTAVSRYRQEFPLKQDRKNKFYGLQYSILESREVTDELAGQIDQDKQQICSFCKNVMNEVLSYIDRNYRESIKLESIAHKFGYNSTYLGKVFKQAVGMNFNTYLDGKRIAYAQALLMENKLKVYEIAAQAGFRNLDYFHKKFKKYVGISPTQFQKEKNLTD